MLRNKIKMGKMLIFSVIGEFSPLLDLHKSVDSGRKSTNRWRNPVSETWLSFQVPTQWRDSFRSAGAINECFQRRLVRNGTYFSPTVNRKQYERARHLKHAYCRTFPGAAPSTISLTFQFGSGASPREQSSSAPQRPAIFPPQLKNFFRPHGPPHR